MVVVRQLHQHLGDAGNSPVGAAEQLEGGKSSDGPGSDGNFERTQEAHLCCCVSFLAKVGIKCSEGSMTLAVLPREHLWRWEEPEQLLALTLGPAQLRLICLKHSFRALSSSSETLPGP